MTGKYLVFITLISCFTVSVFAQKQNVYYLKDSGKEVSTRDSADFIRIVSEPDSGTTLFNIKEYYATGKLKLAGKTSYPDSSVLEGACISFYPSGKRQNVATYSQNRFVGINYDYYPNGTLYRMKNYSGEIKPIATGEQVNFVVITFQDSTGKALVADSNGYYIDYYPDFKKIHEEGNLKDGKRNGNWKGCGNQQDSITNFNEVYDNGKLLTGTSIDIYGKTYTYEQRDVLPEFIGGEKAFGNFLVNTVRYPNAAKKLHETGRVNVTFIIHKNGSVFNVRSTKYASKNLAIEGVRDISLSTGKWKPAIRFGKAIDSEFTVPINFSLAY